jgi:hypothetical protein
MKRNLGKIDSTVIHYINEVLHMDDILKKVQPKNKIRQINKVRFQRAITKYFHLKMLLVLEGHKVTFPNGMTIQIVKYVLTKPIKWQYARFCGKPDQEFAYNPKRSGYQYKFLVESDLLKSSEMTFKVGQVYRKMLHKILTTTSKEYPTYEHTTTSIN